MVPIGFKCGINYQSSTVVQGGEIGNVMRQYVWFLIQILFLKFSQKYDRLFSLRAFDIGIW